MKISGIYKIQSISHPERVYIGSSIDIILRWSKHLFELQHNHHHSIILQNHYNKYGELDLVFSAIEFCSKETLINREQYYMELFNPTFNVCKSAGNCLGTKWTEERKEKWRKQIAGTRTGVNNNFFGKHHTEETKEKFRKPHTKERIEQNRNWHLGRKQSKETCKKHSDFMMGKIRYSKKVINTETGEIFISALEASKYANINYRTFVHYLKGRIKNKTKFIYYNG